MCCDGWSHEIEGEDESEGDCPACGYHCIIVDNDFELLYIAKEGCYYSPVICTTCGASPCDDSC